MSTLPDCVEWSAGFEQMLAIAQNAASRPRDLDQLAALAGSSPHRAYTLRGMCEVEFALRDVANSHEKIGTIDLAKALREANPGATYRHRGRCYRVIRWQVDSYARSIMLKRVKHGEPTQAMLTTYASVSVAEQELFEGHLLQGERGTLAEILLKVTDAVEGYAIGGKAFPYRELSKADRHMRRQFWEFSTSGVYIRISEPWFSGESEQSVKNRMAVADALRTILSHEHDIAPADIRTAHRRVTLCGNAGGVPVQDAIVLFDNVGGGGLRLSSPLFTNFRALVERLRHAAELAGADALVSEAVALRLADWHGSLETSNPAAPPAPRCGADGVVVLAPGTRVTARVRGMLVERTIGEPEYVEINGEDLLVYRCEAAAGGTISVPHHQVEPIGDEWRRVLWQPADSTFSELAA